MAQTRGARIVAQWAGRDRAICYCFQFVRRRHTSAAARSGNSPNFNTLTLDIFHFPLCILLYQYLP